MPITELKQSKPFVYQKKKLTGKKKIIQNFCYHFAYIDSTNDWIIKQEKDLPQGAIVSTDFQYKGKGRWGRNWQTKSGLSALFSVLYRYQKKFPVNLISLCVGVAICESLQKLGVKNTYLKWPNDILIEKKKVAGVLCERFPNFLVIGIGINNLQKQADFSVEIANKACSLFLATNKTIKLLKIIEICSLELDATLQSLVAKKSTSILQKWENYCSPEKNITYKEQKTNEVFFAKILGLDYDNGNLIVKNENGKINSLSAGSITIQKIAND